MMTWIDCIPIDLVFQQDIMRVEQTFRTLKIYKRLCQCNKLQQAYPKIQRAFIILLWFLLQVIGSRFARPSFEQTLFFEKKMEPWDQRYEREREEYDWYISAVDCCDAVEALSGSDDEILHVGCGTSAVGQELYSRGKHFVTNIDSSKTAVRLMSQRCAHLTDMQYVEMDASKLPKDLSGAFQLVLDKALLDCLLCEVRRDKADHYLAEVKRVLKPGGHFCCVSHGIPENRALIIATAFGVPTSRVKVSTLPKPHVPGMQQGASPNYFIYMVQASRGS
jgi:SAM-dependent methyltransferase